MTRRDADRVVTAVQNCLTDNLRKRVYRGDPNPLRGVPQTIRMDNEVHWYLRNENTGKVINPTAGQFACDVEYSQGRGRGFPTPRQGAQQPPPSKRAATVIACARRKLR